MKVLFVNDAATPSGGAELMTVALRDELRGRGHDARLFASTARYGPQPIMADYTCYGTTSALRTPNRVINLSAFWRLRKVLSEFQPDVVHVRMFLTQLSPLILPLLRNVPSLYHAPWYETICPTGLKLLPQGVVCNDKAGSACLRNRCLSPQAWMPLMLQLHLYRRWRDVFKVVVANSEAVKQSLAAHGIGPLRVIWNGVAVRPERSPLTERPTVGYVGRLSWEKGCEVLIQAFATVVRKIPQARLLIAGEGPQRTKLERLVVELGLESGVTMLGQLSQTEVDKQLTSAWLQAYPSLTPEPFASSAAEAMMRGTAVVASQHGGFLDIVEHERTGLLVTPNDATVLAAAMIRVLSDPDLAEQMGQAGRERALERFTRAACVEKFLQLYREIV